MGEDSSVLMHICVQVWDGNSYGGPGMSLSAWLSMGFIKHFVANLK